MASLFRISFWIKIFANLVQLNLAQKFNHTDIFHLRTYMASEPSIHQSIMGLQ